MNSFLIRALFSLCITLGAQLAKADNTPVQDTIDTFHAALLKVMQSGGDFNARSHALRPAVLDVFDFNTISRMSVGRTWRQLETQQQTEFQTLMQDLIVSTYADRFDSYNDQSFDIMEIREPRPNRWLVRARLNRKNNKPVNLDYYLREDGIFNVVADGVSDLALRRADYAAVLKTGGYDGLIANLRANIYKLQNAP